MKFWLSSEDETRRAGAALAAVLLPLASSTPVVVFVRGNLGAGKSTFARGFLSRAGVTGVMPSPTYSLVEPYQTDTLNVFHMDAYRIADGAELDYLGLDEIEQPGSILLVEWPDHVRDELPAPTATVDLEMSPHPDFHPDRHSSANISGHGTTQSSLTQNPVQGAARDRLNPAAAQDAAQDRRNPAAQDRHNPAKFVDQDLTRDRHHSAKSIDRAAQNRHNPEQAQRALSSHWSDLGQAEQAKDQAKDRHSAGFYVENATERHYTSEVGRLLKVTLGAVPVQIEQRLASSGDWQGLFRVVT